MIVDFESKDCFALLTDAKFEVMARIAMSYLLKYTNYDIVLHTQGYESKIKNPRIHVRRFDFAGNDWHCYNSYNLVKPFLALDMIENLDYDRVLFVDSDMLFTPKINDVFHDVKGYLETFPLYTTAPIPDPCTWKDMFTNEISNRMGGYYLFNGKHYSPDISHERMWWRMGNMFMFGKSCGDFYRDVICQIKFAISHPEQTKLMKMTSQHGEPEICPNDGTGFQFPMNAEECYINATLWKYSSERTNMWRESSYFPLFIQEMYDEEHYQWISSGELFEELIPQPRHPLWQNWAEYDGCSDEVLRVQPASPKWLGVPFNGSRRVEPIAYHFSLLGEKKMFWILHEELGGHDESIFNC